MATYSVEQQGDTNKPIFYGTLFENGIIYVNDLLFDTDTVDSFNIIMIIIIITLFKCLFLCI